MIVKQRQKITLIDFIVRNNSGTSLIIGFGDYTGGGLYVEQNDGNFKLHDINRTPLYFDGVKQTHYTEPFEGERWTAIYY
jgi:hypothetical protein